MDACATKQALQERCATSTGLMLGFLSRIQSSQLRCCSGLLYRWISFFPVTCSSIFGSLAANSGSMFAPFDDGSDAVTLPMVRVQNIQPLVPSNLTPF